MLLAFSYHKYIKLFQIDVKYAFLNSFIDEKIYFKQTLGFKNFENPDNSFKLIKLYIVLNRHLMPDMKD